MYGYKVDKYKPSATEEWKAFCNGEKKMRRRRSTRLIQSICSLMFNLGLSEIVKPQVFESKVISTKTKRSVPKRQGNDATPPQVSGTDESATNQSTKPGPKRGQRLQVPTYSTRTTSVNFPPHSYNVTIFSEFFPMF